MKHSLLKFAIKSKGDDSLESFLFFTPSCTNTRQINNSCLLQINTSNGIARLRKMIRLLLENYTFPILLSFDVFKLNKFGFDTEDKAISTFKIFREIKQNFLQEDYK
ncbi:MAG: hypothetical protein CMH70_05340 [Nitrosomonadaceae bacterium]|nr:hypothetical protein [Nitrosomonadaceae bacterium]